MVGVESLRLGQLRLLGPDIRLIFHLLFFDPLDLALNILDYFVASIYICAFICILWVRKASVDFIMLLHRLLGIRGNSMRLLIEELLMSLGLKPVDVRVRDLFRVELAFYLTVGRRDRRRSSRRLLFQLISICHSIN